MFFVSLFAGPRRLETLKIKPKRYKGVQKRGSHLFTNKSVSGYKCAKNESPRDTKNLIKTQKNKKQQLLGKFGFLAAKKTPKVFFYIFECIFWFIFGSLLLVFRVPLLSLSRVGWAGSVPACVCSFL